MPLAFAPLFALGFMPMQARAAHVLFDHPGYRLTSIGERLSVTARVVDAQNHSVPNAAIIWRIADSAVAMVSPQGIVVSKRTGYTKLWAVSGRDSASAYIIVDQWPAKFGFAPSLLRFDAVGLGTVIRVETRDAAGHPLVEASRRPVSCKSLDDRIAKIVTTAHGDSVAAQANGTTYVRCADRGVTDSLLVEVRQRAVSAAIVQKQTLAAASLTVGDTFRVKLQAFDRNKGVVADVRPTFASLEPTVVSVNPVTGLARSVGAGGAEIVAQMGDVADTVRVNIGASRNSILLQAATEPEAAKPDSAAAAAVPKGPSLQIQPFSPTVGDTNRLTIVATDAKGAPIANAQAVLRSADTTVLALLDSMRYFARDTGSVWVVARFGTMRDSTLVRVRPKAAVATDASSAGITAAGHFNRGKFFDSTAAVLATQQQRNKKELDSVAAYILKTSTISSGPTGKFLSVTGLAELASYSNHSSAYSLGVGGSTVSFPSVLQQESGVLFGGMVDMAPFRWVSATGEFKTGALTCATTCEQLTVTEASADITIPRGSWLALRGGYGLRSESNLDGLQRWQYIRAGVITRFDLVGGMINTVLGVSAFPSVTFSGRSDSPSIPSSLGGDAGLEIHTGVFTEALIYHIDRFDYNSSATAPARVDQFSTLRLRIGLQRGR